MTTPTVQFPPDMPLAELAAIAHRLGCRVRYRNGLQIRPNREG